MDHFIISCTNLHLKYLHWLFVSCRVLALPLSTSEKIKNSNFLSDLKRQARFFLRGEVKSFHLYPEPFLLPPESKCINIPLWAGWDIWSSLEHFRPKLINMIKYLASPGYQISACVSTVTGYYQCLHVYLFTHIPGHSPDIAPISWHDTLSLSLLSPDSIILMPEARLVARAAYCSTVHSAPPSPLHPLLSEYR